MCSFGIRIASWIAVMASSLMLADVADAADPRPNILLILADDIGYEALGCYGGLDFQTPRLDAMAASGLRFSRAYASPVCTPTRVSLHTGLYTTRHRHGNVLPVHLGTAKTVDFQSMPTFAQSMRTAGYATSVTGKWQLATLEKWPNHIRDAGFDSWCIWQIWRQGKKTLRHWNPTLNQDGQVREDIADRFGPDVLVDYVIDQMKSARDAEQPFLIVHNEMLPHDPIIQTPEDRRLDRRAKLDHMIHYMDHLVGRLTDAVDSLGIRDNTYVVFMGDNGTHEEDFRNPQAKQPGQRPHTRHTKAGDVNGGKAKMGDAGSHVPLIVWGPSSVPVGQVCNDLVDVVDLFPTFCELSQTSIPADTSIDGRSIAAQIHGRSGIQRPWTHHGYLGEENLFDGSWRLSRKTGTLKDARSLPEEPIAAADDEDAKSARKRLQSIFERLTVDGPRPPEPF